MMQKRYVTNRQKKIIKGQNLDGKNKELAPGGCPQTNVTFLLNADDGWGRVVGNGPINKTLKDELAETLFSRPNHTNRARVVSRLCLLVGEK